MSNTRGGGERRERGMFATRIGAIAATVGSAVGLGNIWRFPYEAGTHGGGAFLLCYIVFVVIIGVPIVTAEFILGRQTRSNIFGAFSRLAPRGHWQYVGYIGILASTLIMGFYTVVSGWTLEYLYQSIVGGLNFENQAQFHQHLQEFKTDNFRPLFWTLVFIAINFVVLRRSITQGIEKLSNIMMPILFVILIIFCINSFTMSGFKEGLEFIFKPDISHIDSATLLNALGQSFFSLSIGLGCLVTYASYFSKETRLTQTSTITASLSVLVAILASIIIFPAVFTYGMSAAEGPTLVFEVLPTVFHKMHGGMIWSTLFFFLLAVASLTSTLSMGEIAISFLVDEKHWSRAKSTTVSFAVITVLAVLCSLSFGALRHVTLFDKNIFDICDYVASNILLPLGGLIVSVFVGWKLKKSIIRDQMTNYGQFRCIWMGLLIFILRWVAPIAIICIFLHSLGLF